MAQHDSHEFMVYILDQLQIEQMPKNAIRFDGNDQKLPYSQQIEQFDRAFPTLIDRIFSGLL